MPMANSSCIIGITLQKKLTCMSIKITSFHQMFCLIVSNFLSFNYGIKEILQRI
jgi:hypothetical protein